MAAIRQAGAAPDQAQATAQVIERLRSAAAVRERCGRIHAWVADNRSAHFTLDEDRLQDVARYVADVTRAAYPDLAIPLHSRWRHFSAGGIDRWKLLSARLAAADDVERTRAAIDLAMISVLLDAGAGDRWCYREPATGQVFARSEGLAVASFDMFAAGAFSSERGQPLRADATRLPDIDVHALARGFQVDGSNPLVGLEGRAVLLRRLGVALGRRPGLFGRAPARPGNIVDHLRSGSADGRVSAPGLLSTLLEALAPIWPSGLAVQGIPLGDAGRHRAIRAADASDGIVPFHKLPQWLTYSLIEPLQAAGLRVVDLAGLTALAEYRNGGLLIDLGVIRPRRPIDPAVRHDVSSELIVEWRALTLALMDRLIAPVRQCLGLDSTFVLPQLLQGGSWSAGRKIAATLRPPHAPPPIAVAADGTVF